MRFRLASLEDVPAMTTLYGQFLDTNPRVYPDYTDRELAKREFAAASVLNMMQNPRWFCIVAVVDSRLDGETVVGGRAKGMITAIIGQRILGSPKLTGFCEYLVVDEKFRGRGTARKLALIGGRKAYAMGAEVIECGWVPGSPVGALWEAIGYKPYLIFGAFINEDGSPRQELVLIETPKPGTIKPEDV